MGYHWQPGAGHPGYRQSYTGIVTTDGGAQYGSAGPSGIRPPPEPRSVTPNVPGRFGFSDRTPQALPPGTYHQRLGMLDGAPVVMEIQATGTAATFRVPTLGIDWTPMTARLDGPAPDNQAVQPSIPTADGARVKDGRLDLWKFCVDPTTFEVSSQNPYIRITLALRDGPGGLRSLPLSASWDPRPATPTTGFGTSDELG